MTSPVTAGVTLAGDAPAAAAVPGVRRLAVTKGHGTQNDFVLIDDRRDELVLDAPLVRALTDRHAGVGADGVIRVVATADVPEGADLLAADPDAAWFMDYRN